MSFPNTEPHQYFSYIEDTVLLTTHYADHLQAYGQDSLAVYKGTLGQFILTLKVLNFWKFTSYCSLKPLWSGTWSSAGSYLANPTSPIPSHCASIVATSTERVNNDEQELILSVSAAAGHITLCCNDCTYIVNTDPTDRYKNLHTYDPLFAISWTPKTFQICNLHWPNSACWPLYLSYYFYRLAGIFLHWTFPYPLYWQLLCQWSNWQGIVWLFVSTMMLPMGWIYLYQPVQTHYSGAVMTVPPHKHTPSPVWCQHAGNKPFINGINLSSQSVMRRNHRWY